MRFVIACVLFAGIVVGTVALCAAQEQQQSPQEQSQPQGNPDQQAAPAPPGQQTMPAPSSAPESAAQPKSPDLSPGTTSPHAPPDTDHPVLKRRPAKKTNRKRGDQISSGKVIIRNGGAKEGTPELSPGLSNEQQAHNRENTQQLLATTDANLKSAAGRQLTPAQQTMVEQIHAYMAQSKKASDTGDLNRAHTLAFKAHLLSDELAKK